MKDASKIMEVYNVNPGYRFVINYLCPVCCCKRRQQELKDLQFMKRNIVVSRADEPDEIKWENNGYSGTSRTCRRIIVFIIAMVLILAGVIALV